MTRSEAKMILWTPDAHDLVKVAEAVEEVLSAPVGDFCSLDRRQATHLLTTFFHPGQYVRPSMEEVADGGL